MDAVSRSLGTRRWRYAVDPPESIPPADVRHASAIGAVATADELASLFMAAAPQGNLPTDLGAKLVALCQAAHHQYPHLAIDDRELATALGARASTTTIDLVDRYLSRCEPGDLALALMAARGVEVAIAELERVYRLTIDSTCRRFASTAHSADDLKQILRERLLAGKLADYAGQGLLDSWLRIAAVRIFLDLSKRDRSLPHADLGLEPGDRHLLRQHLVMRLSIDQLAAVLGLSRDTVARRITRARERLQRDGRTLADVMR